MARSAAGQRTRQATTPSQTTELVLRYRLSFTGREIGLTIGPVGVEAD